MIERDRVVDFSKIKEVISLPHLLEIQFASYNNNFLQLNVSPTEREDKGLHAIFKKIFPIENTRGTMRLEYISYDLGSPKYTVEECKERNITYCAPLRAKLRLVKLTGEGEVSNAIEQDVYLGDLPLITDRGTFMINGSERVVVNQLHRSPGCYLEEEIHPNGKRLCSVRVIPDHGSWLEFTTDINDVIYAYIDRTKKVLATIFLRALGFEDNDDILKLFYSSKSETISEKIVGKAIVNEVVHPDTGEVLIEAYKELTPDDVKILKELKYSRVKVLNPLEERDIDLILPTLRKDTTRTQEEAITRVFNAVRPGESMDIESSQEILTALFFNPKRYDLGKVGRFKMNLKLGLDIPEDVRILTLEDIVAMLKKLILFVNRKEIADDIDHLGNRRVRSVGELLGNQFMLGLIRMARVVRERMSLRESDSVSPQDLVSARTISAVVNNFFGSSQLSQFMDQTNPLAELNHKRRLSALGPGGLSRERAGFEVRDVHYSQYGRICPIETPEGHNIGLITNMATFSKVDDFGFLATPYRRVVDGQVTSEVVYLNAREEENYTIAQANAKLDEENRFIGKLVRCRRGGEFVMASPLEIQFMDVSPKQVVGVSASLIPFLEHDDANRALMGSNMQRQAVPLLQPEPPIVGTGLENLVARDSGAVIIAKRDGVVKYVDSSKIVIETTGDDSLESWLLGENIDVYNLTKFEMSNQNTCIHNKPLVKEGQSVKAGTVIADGTATKDGYLALGRNILVAFMPWRGYNYEDAIVISERLLEDDTFSSIHIHEYSVEVRETKLGPEETTREVPNVSSEALRNLGDDGIVRIGAYVKPGDVLVGKVTPKGETELTPEERLLQAIFGEKAADVLDTSLKVPPGMEGIVTDIKVFSRKGADKEQKELDAKRLEEMTVDYNKKRKHVIQRRNQRLIELLSDKPVVKNLMSNDNTIIIAKGETFSSKRIVRINWDKVKWDFPITGDDEVDLAVRNLVIASESALQKLKERLENEEEKVKRGEDLSPGVLKLIKVYIARKSKIQIGDKIAGRHGNKGVVSMIVPKEDMPFLPDGTPVDIILNPLGVPSRMNVGQLLETHLGWAAKTLGITCICPVFEGASVDEIKELLKRAGLPTSGKTILYDGVTGEPFDNEVVVGYIYMMKLNHLVEDKIHARSTGPYSLVTQQPLGGKAQFGGQRFGEMEVWALEGYGAAYTLREILTLKSDDVMGRAKLYESIVRNENPPVPGIPESFNVLVKELQSLCLNVELQKIEEEE